VPKADVREMTPEQKTAFHEAAEAKVQPVRYAPPTTAKGPKTVMRLASTDLVTVLLQIVRDGGENNLHFHTNADTLYMVLRGSVRFHGVGDKLIGEFSDRQGVVLPGGTRYWFEKIGADDLELLQVISKDVTTGASERINIEAHKEWMEQMVGSTISLTNYGTAAPKS
jgi:mannose-6-phosphate isomerase-like protein (cupin superfamily)